MHHIQDIIVTKNIVLGWHVGYLSQLNGNYHVNVHAATEAIAPSNGRAGSLTRSLMDVTPWWHFTPVL